MTVNVWLLRAQAIVLGKVGYVGGCRHPLAKTRFPDTVLKAPLNWLDL